MQELLSPKQVARAIGVSESTLKRWCDQGLIETVRTGGGHRKMPLCGVMRFLREHDHAVVCPELLGLPICAPGSEIGLEKGCPQLVHALLDGNESLARQIIFNLYFAKHSISVICDQVMCRAFREIGELWACQSADVYQERRGCEIVQRILYELRRAQPAADPNWSASGGSLEGDDYALPTSMAELVLRDAGWNAISLGVSIPAISLANAIVETRPKLFWVCVSAVAEEDRFVSEFGNISAAAESVGTALAVGGRGLNQELRQRIRYCCYCDTMQHLEAFAKTIRRIARASETTGAVSP